MNDLRPLHRYHDAQPAPDPSSVDRMRARLNNHLGSEAPTSRPRRRVRPMWGLAAVGAATAAVAAATLLPGNTDHGLTPAAPPVSSDSGRTVLLATAGRAATQPTGKYWRVVTTASAPRAAVDADWITLDGWHWSAYRNPVPGPGEKRAGLFKSKGTPRMPVTVLGPNPPLSALLKLPTEPKALRALASAHGDAAYVIDALVGLMTDQPATPGTRAAAFRALAEVPGVRSLGPQIDTRGRKGTGLTFDYDSPKGRRTARLIIDTRTSQVLARSTTGAMVKTAKSAMYLYLATGWTNESPRIP